MTFPINPANRLSVQDKININNYSKNKAGSKLTSDHNVAPFDTVEIPTSDQNNLKATNGIKGGIDNTESAKEVLNYVKHNSKNLIKAQAKSTPQNVLNLLA